MDTISNHRFSLTFVVAAASGFCLATRTASAKVDSVVKGIAQADAITVADGTRLYFKDWGSGQPVVGRACGAPS